MVGGSGMEPESHPKIWTVKGYQWVQESTVSITKNCPLQALRK